MPIQLINERYHLTVTPFATPQGTVRLIVPGNAPIQVRILADADLDFLFPKNAGSAQGGVLVQAI